MIPPRAPEAEDDVGLEHDKPWRMTKTVIHEKSCPVSPYEYRENPPTELTRKKEEDDDKRGWRATYKGMSRPSPSVATNLRNLKTSFPHSFSLASLSPRSGGGS